MPISPERLASLEQLSELSTQDRLQILSEYLADVAEVSRRIDRLGELFSDLPEGDGLQTGLAAVTYVWAAFEAELLDATRGRAC